jgi:response regulator NasT
VHDAFGIHQRLGAAGERGLTEEQAYVLMRSTAMREKKKIADIAQSIVTASDILK